MYIDCEQAKHTFLSYANSYDTTNPRIALKLDHSLRVAQVCRRIAQSEGFSGQDCNLAWLVGLLHDIGRFEQLRRWNTFSDAQSTSHADLSVDVLFNGSKSCFLRSFVKNSQEDELIRTAIQLHSAFCLPDNLPKRTNTYCTIVRDADKLDIMNTMQTSTPETIMNSTLAELAQSKISPEVKEAFLKHRCVKREERQYPADYVIGFICFVFELNFPESYRIALENKDALKLASSPFGLQGGFTDPDTQDFFEKIKRELKDYLASRAS